MEDKLTAIYVMVRDNELNPEDAGSYNRPLARQKASCLEYLKQKEGGDALEKAQVYTSRKDLFLDIERNRIARLIINDLGRLGSTEEEIEGILFELRMGGVDILTIEKEHTG